MDKVWTYEELTRAVEDKMLAFASMLDVLPPPTPPSWIVSG